jgi:hypothetical protein
MASSLPGGEHGTGVQTTHRFTLSLNMVPFLRDIEDGKDGLDWARRASTFLGGRSASKEAALPSSNLRSNSQILSTAVVGISASLSCPKSDGPGWDAVSTIIEER